MSRARMMSTDSYRNFIENKFEIILESLISNNIEGNWQESSFCDIFFI